jgi:hypothetical protein
MPRVRAGAKLSREGSEGNKNPSSLALNLHLVNR